MSPEEETSMYLPPRCDCEEEGIEVEECEDCGECTSCNCACDEDEEDEDE